MRVPDDNRAVQAHAYLVGRAMVGVGMIPVRSRRTGVKPERVGVAFPRRNRMERAAVGDEGEVQPVPVHCRFLREVVSEVDDHAVPLGHL